MGVRPPRQDADEPDVIEFGIAALDARLDRAEADISFPADAREIVRALGDPDIDYDAHGHSVSLSAALADVEQDRFESEQELLNALHPVFESHRASASTGLMDAIRSMLPFGSR